MVDDKGNGWENFVLRNIPGEHSMNGLMQYIYYLESHLFNDKLTFNAIQGTNVLNEYIINYQSILKSRFPSWENGDPITFEMWLQVPEVLRTAIIKQIMASPGLLRELIGSWKIATHKNLISPEFLLKQQFFNPRNTLDARPFCNEIIPSCSKGTQLIHSIYKEENWTNSYGWHCELCPPQTYKDVDGNSKCIPCEKPLQTDDLKTKCFDPFTTVLTARWSLLGLCVLILSVFNIIGILVTMVIFIRY